MDKMYLEGLEPEQLLEGLSDQLEAMDEEDFDLETIDAYLEALERKDPVAPGQEADLDAAAFLARHAQLLPTPQVPLRRGPKFRRLAGRVAAVAAVIVVGTALMVSGRGGDLLGTFARWSKGQFLLTTAQGQQGYAPSIWEDDTAYSHGQAALDAYGVEEKMMPVWKPAHGGEIPGLEVSVTQTGGVTLFTEAHRTPDGWGYTFEVRQHASPEEAQADLVGVEDPATLLYEFDGRNYYISPTAEDEYTVTWTVAHFSGRIYGNMDLETARHFARSVTKQDETPYLPPDMSVPPEYDTIQKAMAAIGLDESYAPTWLPQGFVPVQSNAWAEEGAPWISASLFSADVAGERNLMMSIDCFTDPEAVGSAIFEKDDTPVIEYQRGDITFYVMSNLTRRTVVWSDGMLQGSFSGELTVEECQAIIDSIPAYAP